MEMTSKTYIEYMENLYNDLFPHEEESFKSCLYRKYLNSAAQSPTGHKNEER